MPNQFQVNTKNAIVCILSLGKNAYSLSHTIVLVLKLVWRLRSYAFFGVWLYSHTLFIWREKLMIVTFFGHSYLSTDEIISIQNDLHNKIIGLINNGATEFLLGGYGGFDIAAATNINILKKKFPDIKSYLIIPYINRKYDKSLYDHVKYPEFLINVNPKYAIPERNKYMVEQSDVVVSYVYRSGGAMKAVEYAKKLNKQIIKIKA